MTSYWIKLTLVLLCSLFFKAVIPEKTRDNITPYVFAFYIGAQSFASSLTGWPAVINIAMGYVIRAFLLDGFQLRNFRNNPTMNVFLVFWIYMIFSMLLGEFPGYAAMYYLDVLVESVMVGYFVGMRILRGHESWGRFLRVLSVVSALCLLFYARHGIFTSFQGGEMSEELRSTISFEGDGNEVRVSNENYVGLLIASLLPYPFLLITGRHFGDSRAKWVKSIAHLTFVLLALALVRTGSRNACLSLVPILAYLFFAKTTLPRSRKVVFRIMVAVAMVGTIAFSVGSMDRLRIFTASKYNADVTSGRWAHFEDKLYGRTESEKWFGCGALYDHRFYNEEGRALPPMSNGHSVYFQILKQSGNVGIALFLLVFVAVWNRARKLGARGHVILLLFFVWAFCGVGESFPLLSEGLFKPLVGIALAFCTRMNMPGAYQLSEGNFISSFVQVPGFGYEQYPHYRG